MLPAGNDPRACAVFITGVPVPGIRVASSKGDMAHKAKKTAKSTLGRVLLVEDDPVLALSLEYALRDGGAADVVNCATMRETMAEIESGKFDIMILDVHLADRDDGWALAELMTVIGHRPPRFVFATGSPEDIPPEIANLGLVFEKPYDPDHLVQVLATGSKQGLFGRLRAAITSKD